MDPGLEALRFGDEAAPAREGLPPRYRMRADAHYVEQLDTALFSSPIRFLEVRTLDSPRPDEDVTPSQAFVDSIKRHGVLQPLLVRTRGGRHMVIAGRKRLAAATAAGLSTVPCLVERVDDDQAPVLAAATNMPSTDTATAVLTPQAASPDVAFAAFADCLTAVASSANLLSPGSTLTQSVAVDLVRAEAARALQLLVATRVLRGEVAVGRRAVSLRSLIDRAVEQTASERRLRGVAVDVSSTEGVGDTIWGDEDLLVAAVSALIVAPAMLLDAPRSRVVSLHAAARPEGAFVFTAVHESAELPHYWRSKLASNDWPDLSMPSAAGSHSAFVLLRSARRIAERHDGHMTLECADGRTSVSIAVRVGRTSA